MTFLLVLKGEYTLDINPVTLEDDATFQCQVGAADGVAPIRSKDAVLTVTVPPEFPDIVNGHEIRTTEDTTLHIECVSRGGKPAAEVSQLFKSMCMPSGGGCFLPVTIHLCRSSITVTRTRGNILLESSRK